MGAILGVLALVWVLPGSDGGTPTQPADSGVSQEGSGRGSGRTRMLGRHVLREGVIQRPRERPVTFGGPRESLGTAGWSAVDGQAWGSPGLPSCCGSR